MIMISIIVASYTLVKNTDNQKPIEKRVQTMNALENAIENDIPRQLYVIGYRFLFTAESTVLESGTFLTNVSALFQEAFTNGTVNNQNVTILIGTTQADMQTTLQTFATNMNANFTLRDPHIVIFQTDPWHVAIQLTANLQLIDQNNLVQYNKTKIFQAKIPLDNFDDPLYVVYTSGRVVPKIRQSPFTPFSLTSATNLSSHLEGKFYIASPTAPSFLTRLEGKNTSDTYGIESLVNLGEFAKQGLPTEQKSIVDYIYFSQANPAACQIHTPVGLQSWLYIDTLHQGIYNVSC